MLTKGFAMAAVMLAALPAGAQTAKPYDRLFVFGDSLVDAGNAQAGRAASGGEDPAPAAQGYYQGRFSNGLTYADWLSRGVEGQVTTASAYGGRNFSVGGAQAREVAGDASPSFAEQVASFRTSGQQFTADSLVLVTLGGNDIRSELAKLGANPRYVPDFAPTLTAMSEGLTSLYTLGARNFVITGLPDVGQIPVVTQFNSDALEAAGRQMSLGLNTAFDGLTDQFAERTGANFIFFDFFAYQARIYADPTAAGLPAGLNTTEACLGTTAAPACTNYTYFDGVHPTRGIHQALGSGIAGQLGVNGVPEPATWALMILGFGAVGGAMRRRGRAPATA